MKNFLIQLIYVIRTIHISSLLKKKNFIFNSREDFEILMLIFDGIRDELTDKQVVKKVLNTYCVSYDGKFLVRKFFNSFRKGK